MFFFYRPSISDIVRPTTDSLRGIESYIHLLWISLPRNHWIQVITAGFGTEISIYMLMKSESTVEIRLWRFIQKQ